MINIEGHFLEHGIKPSSVRILVWRCIEEQTEAFSLGDIERQLIPMDKSSIFRALRLFTEHHLLHEIDDGMGHKKYCICRCHNASHHVHHVHFTCTSCGKTFCLEDHTIPAVKLPYGYIVQDMEFVIKGVCPACSKQM